MKILAFDISSQSTGYAVIEDGLPNKDAYGLICPNKKQSLGQRLNFFSDEVCSLISLYSPDIVCVEEIFKGVNIKAFKVLAMYRGVAIKTIYEQTKRDPISLMAVEVRKILNVRFKKEEAFKDITKKFGLTKFKNFEKHNDIIDAFGLGLATYKLITENIKIEKRKRKKNVRRKTK